MIRLIGILTGSAIAIATLIIALGVPRLTPPDSEPVAGSVAAEPDIAIPSPQRPVADAQAQPETAEASAADEPVADAAPDDATPPDAALIEQVFAAEESRQIIRPDTAEAVVDDHWYAFWSPFRSELAANGFVTRLQETTGLDYRVVKVKTGVYEVAFAYTDEDDIETKLERIATATGLDLTGG